MANLLIAHPSLENREFLQHLIESSRFPLDVVPVATLADLFTQADTLPEASIVLTELVWDGINCQDSLLYLSLAYPRLSIALVSEYDLDQIITPDYPLPRVSGLQYTELITALVSTLSEDLRGQFIGSYQIQDYAGQNFLGRVYAGFQPALKRQVHITFAPLHAPDYESQRFRDIASARAGNTLPSICAIYETSQFGDRDLLITEPPPGRTLFERILSNQYLDDRLVARTLHTALIVLQHLHRHGISHTPFKSTDLALSDDGVIKILNTALPSYEPMPHLQGELSNLATLCSHLLEPSQQHVPALLQLLQEIQEGSVPLPHAAARANQIDIDLAPEVSVPQRLAAQQAALEVKKARSRKFWIFLSSILGCTLLITAAILFSLSRYFLVKPPTYFESQRCITAGPVTLPNGKIVDLPVFYIDQHEVTIGQYSRFLNAVRSTDPATLLPPGYTGTKKDFTPKDWETITDTIKRKGLFIGEPLLWDSPIFNIDYADACAYAKWAGKRLPTELEWQRAAAGNNNYRLPWGDEPSPAALEAFKDNKDSAGLRNYMEKIYAKYNNGARAPGSQLEAGAADGHLGPTPVDAFPTDASPFQVLNMAGNVSEWVTPSPQLPEPAKGTGIYRGGSFATLSFIGNQFRNEHPLASSQAWLGFRCASDHPTQADSK